MDNDIEISKVEMIHTSKYESKKTFFKIHTFGSMNHTLSMKPRLGLIQSCRNFLDSNNDVKNYPV